MAIADDLASLRGVRSDSGLGERLVQGAHVQIIGEIRNRQYVAKDGANKSVTEIRIRIARLDRTPKAAVTEGAAA